MARRTKAEKIDVEMKSALEEALDFDFNAIVPLQLTENRMSSSRTDSSMTSHSMPSQSMTSHWHERKNRNHTLSEQKNDNWPPDRDLDEAFDTSLDPFFDLELSEGKDISADFIASDEIERLERRIASATLGFYDTLSEKDLEQKSNALAASPLPALPALQLERVEDSTQSLSAQKPSQKSFSKSSLSSSGAGNDDDDPDNDDPDDILLNQELGDKNPSDVFLKNPIYLATAVLSALWTVSSVSVIYHFAPIDSMIELIPFLFSTTQGLLMMSGAVIPIFLFWGFAQLSRRTKELQHAARNMTGAAMRLLEPDKLSAKRVVSLGQAIRREVQAMGDGLDRTVSRASELEALLQSEVNHLEHAYGENEARIRTLIVELANEREAVSSHADNVKAKITGAKDQLTQEFNSIADHIQSAAESFTISLSETLNARWGELVREFNLANEDVAQQLSQKFVETIQSFDESRGRFFSEIDERFYQIDQHTEKASKTIAESLGGKMDDFVKIVHERTNDIEGKFHSLTGRLANSGEKIIEAVDGSVLEIEKRSHTIDQKLRSTADKVLEDFNDKFQKLDHVFTDRSNQSLNEFTEQLERLEDKAQDLPLTFKRLAEASVHDFSRQVDHLEKEFEQISVTLSRNGSEFTSFINQGIHDIAQNSEALGKQLNQSSQNILQSFDNRLHEVETHFSNRGNTVINLFHEQIERLEEQVEAVSSRLQSSTVHVIDEFEKQLANADNILGERGATLVQSFIDRTQSFEKTTENLGQILESHVDRVNETFHQRTRDVADTFTGGRNDILSLIDETRIRLSHEMEIVGTTIGRLVDERAGGFIHQFIEGREKLSYMLEAETTRIVNAVQNQMQVLSKHVSDIEHGLLGNIDILDSHTEEHKHALENQIHILKKALIDSFNFTYEAMEAQAQNMDVRSDALRQSLALNNDSLDKVLGEQGNIIEKRIAQIHDVVSQGNDSLSETMDRQITSFQAILNSKDETLKDIFVHHIDNLEEQITRLKEHFYNYQNHLFVSLDTKINSFKDSLSDSRESIENSLSQHSGFISDRALELQNNLVETLSTADERLENQGKLLDKRAYELRDAVDYNSSILEDSFLRQVAVIDERTKTMQKAIEIGVGNVRNVLENNAILLSDTLRERISEVSSTVGHETSKAEEVISSATLRLADSVVGAVRDADQKIADRALFLKESVNDLGSQLDMGMAQIESRMTYVASSLTNEAEKAGDIISDAGIKISGSMIEAAKEAEKIFSERSIVLKENISALEEDLSSAFYSVEQKLTDHSYSFKNDMDQIEGRIAQLTQNTSEHLITQTDNLHTLTEQLRHAATKTGDSLGTLTIHFSDQLKEVMRAAEDRLRSENETFINNFSGHANNSVSLIQSAQTEIENHIVQLFEQLDASNSSIGRIVDNLKTNVVSADQQLFQMTEKFKQTVSDLANDFDATNHIVSDNFQNFTTLSQTALRDAGQFSERFESHARILSDMISLFDRSHQIFSEKLGSHQGLLENLTDGLVQKSEKMTNMIQEYEHIMEVILKNTEERTYSSNEKMHASLSNFINQAVDKFVAATRQIRHSSDEIREELSQVTVDLNSNMRSLPAQTREYAENIRAAIKEQIISLRDLSSLVEKAVSKENKKQLKDKLDSSYPEQDVHYPRAQDFDIRPSKMNARLADFQSDLASNGFEQKNPTRQKTVPSPTLQNGHTRGTNGSSMGNSTKKWVSDLLAQASKDDSGHSLTENGRDYSGDNRSIETLHSISSDIVQGIDQNAIAQLWQHYRRGQKNIVPDHLYTADGQYIFEKIKRKYTVDGEFRRSVGQYISDFERLLGDVTKNGGNTVTLREYLTSDTGKVYTMLAHVSGRIQ